MASRFQFNFTALNLVLPVDIDAWNTYNSKGEITQYDATFKYWQWVVDYLIGAAAKKFGTKSPEATVGVLTQTIAKSICGTAMKSCNGTNTQYASSAECLNFLTKQVRFGKAYELGTLLPLYLSPLPSSSGSPSVRSNTSTARLTTFPPSLRQKHPPLPHGPPKHGALPPGRALLAYRPVRRRILQRRQELSADRQ